MNIVALVFTLGALVVSLSFAQDHTCDDNDYNKKLILNCGNGECQCDNQTARCRGNISKVIIPSLRTNITDIYIECYNLSNLDRVSFKNIELLDLRKITLRRNEIGNISEDIFSNFSKLIAVDIGDDANINLTSLSIALGSIQKRLPLNITLDNIGLENVNETYFHHVNISNVKYLSLKGNMITEMNLAVHSFPTLVEISLSYNKINRTGNYTLTRLRYLDLSYNHLTEEVNFCGENSNTSFYPNLERLLLVKNRIGTIKKELSKNWDCLKHLEHLDLSKNSIKILNMSIFSNLSSLKSLILTKNWINEVELGEYPDNLQKIDFQNNEFVVFPPILCDNSNSTYPNIRELNFSRNYIQQILLTNWSCLPGITTLDFSKNDVQELKNNTFANFTNLTHLYLDNMVPWVKTIEPAAFNSSSLQNLSVRFNMIDFRKKEQATNMFKLCPNVKWLDISYNIFIKMNESSIVEILSPLKDLEVLKAQHISLRKIPSEIILHFKSLRYLDINRNLLSVIQFPESFNNESLTLALRYLSAAEGDINTIQQNSFPTSIRKSLEKLDISDNEFACTCELRWFRDNAKDGKIGNITLLKWPNMYVCRSPTKLEDNLVKNFKPVEDCEHIKPIIIACIAVGCSLFVFTTLFATVYWNRWYVQYYWYKISKRHKEGKSGDSEIEPFLFPKQYDGYVVYNSKDGSFVHHTFRNFMEGHLGYKLHIWERNAANGALVDVILDAIYASKHVIVIVSDNLMKDQWCKFQVDVAIDRGIDLAETYVTLVVLEDVKVKFISKAWCVLLTKTPTAHWCGCEEEDNDIKRKYFEQKIKKQLGKPLSEEQRCDGE